jgi:lysophospholipase L1-like esterase
MKRKLFLLLFCFIGLSCSVLAQRHDFANYQCFAKDNAALGKPAKGEKRVLFIGNSITIGWMRTHPSFFEEHNYIDRGISGQTSYQILLRFREDVIKLMPKVVVINYGTNDVAENTGTYDEELTYGNVVSMCELAKANKIKVILTSCLPAGQFKWRPSITDAMAKIRHLNERVKAYAKLHKIPYVDYFSAMVSDDGSCQNPSLCRDGVHPNSKGYDIMESLLQPIIKKIL